MIMSDAMIILLIIWWCIVYSCMCIELLHHIYNVYWLCTRGCCDARPWVMVDTAFYTTIVFMVTESALFIWR